MISEEARKAFAAARDVLAADAARIAETIAALDRMLSPVEKKENPAGVSARALRQEAEFSQPRFKAALGELLAAAKIERLPGAKSYRLTP